MTDREAIKVLEGFYHSEKAKNYGDVPQARGLAISALKEREERGKGCEGCCQEAYSRDTYPCNTCIRNEDLYADQYTETD